MMMTKFGMMVKMMKKMWMMMVFSAGVLDGCGWSDSGRNQSVSG